MLGKIPPIAAQDLHLIRKIRNDFAHLPSKVTFSTEPITSRCLNLQTDGLPKKTEPRKKFLRASMSTLGFIEGAISQSSHIESKTDVDLKSFREINEKLIGPIIEEIRNL